MRTVLFCASLGTGMFSRAVYQQRRDCSSSSGTDNNNNNTAHCFWGNGNNKTAANSTATTSDFSSNESTSSSSSNPVSFDVIRNGEEWGQAWDSKWDGHNVGADRNVRHQILLIRHGQYRNETSGAPDSERTLTETGIEQARLTGIFLRNAIINNESEFFVSDHINSFTSSNLTRAMETADHMIGAFDTSNSMKQRWTIDGALAERFPCNPSPPYPKKAKRECHTIVEGAFKKYITRPLAGESTRIDVLCIHANIIRYFLCRALQLPPEAWLRISLPHASITSLTVRGNGSVSVNTVGAASHLPPHLQTLHNLPS